MRDHQMDTLAFVLLFHVASLPDIKKQYQSLLEKTGLSRSQLCKTHVATFCKREIVQVLVTVNVTEIVCGLLCKETPLLSLAVMLICPV